MCNKPLFLPFVVVLSSCTSISLRKFKNFQYLKCGYCWQATLRSMITALGRSDINSGGFDLIICISCSDCCDG